MNALSPWLAMLCAYSTLCALGLSLDPGANPAGLTTSNAADGILGW